MTNMILLNPRINQNIINENNNKHIKIRIKHSVHKIHERCRSISQTKCHDSKLIMTISGPKSCIRDVTLSYSQLMIARSEIYLRKTSGTLKLIEEIINSQKRILILDSNLVQLTVIYTHPKRTIFLPHK
ncbi:hypothetical protein R3W88_022319 [Solanum pinnatisectum]|uniref:Uncharacterized protein n=1 Tax=Solanum pinnatisectum TaxID=50273 RepID=A0AAV9LUB7_9SOLN|nr:hypothetical protein R3W88_022319 [Solanum pinnatisectum]